LHILAAEKIGIPEKAKMLIENSERANVILNAFLEEVQHLNKKL
jgi:hypothetical protein|tara:strand:+ start:261 stop:392 length:132 start_codon:yes stop_codon:yes gene_type:complete